MKGKARMDSVKRVGSYRIANTKLLKAWTNLDGMTYIIVQDDVDLSAVSEDTTEDIIVSGLKKRQKTSGIFFIHNSNMLWARKLICPIMNALSAYMNHLGTETLDEFMESNLSANLRKVEVIQSLVEQDIDPIDLWCVFAGLSSFSTNEIPDGLVERVTSERAPVRKMNKRVLSIHSPFSYLSPIFPNNYPDSIALMIAPNTDEKLKNVSQLVMFFNWQVATMKEAEQENINAVLTSSRVFSDDEMNIMKTYLTKSFTSDVLNKVRSMDYADFISFLSRIPEDGDKNSNDYITGVLLDRVLDGFVFVEKDSVNDGYLPDSYFTLTEYEVDVYKDVLRSLYFSRNFIKDSFNYEQFVKNPYLFSLYASSYEAVNSAYESVLADKNVVKSAMFPSGDNGFYRHMESGLFNLREIFVKFMNGSDIPLEMLVAIELDVPDGYHTW